MAALQFKLTPARGENNVQGATIDLQSPSLPDRRRDLFYFSPLKPPKHVRTFTGP